MSNRVLRIGFFAVPLLGTAMGLVAACADETSPDGQDASADVPVIDGGRSDSGGHDSGGMADARPDVVDSSISDAGTDADAAALKPLCETYPNSILGGDAAVGEPENTTRYTLIAIRALFTGSENAANSCEIGSAFVEDPDPFVPVPYMCLGKQLAALAGCLVQGTPVDYLGAQDDNNDYCVSDAGPSVQVGFHDPATKGYTANDVDFMLDLVKKAAVNTGMAPADAERLKALLETQKTKAALGDAGLGDAGFSQSSCP